MNLPFSDKRLISILEILLIISICLLPLFLKYPYRINIFLSWEGAYRLSIGQIPFRDFGLPMGFMYWMIPAMFFKIFGPYMISLLKAQAFLNLITLFSFREVQRTFGLSNGLRFITLLLFAISYILINFWPWYNNTVFVYQLISLLLLIRGSLEVSNKKWIYFSLSSLFVTFSFFTKQDGGALALLLNLVVLIYVSWKDQNWWYFLGYAGFTFILFLGFIIPFWSYDFGYWFNYGQEPHFSRLDIHDLLFFILQGSFWLKLYIVVTFLLIFIDIQKAGWKEYVRDKKNMVFTLVTLGIYVQALIIQVTSYVPINNNIYFHSFGLAYILTKINWPFNKEKLSFTLIGSLMIMLWWSGSYYKYINKIISIGSQKVESEQEDRVSVRTYTKSEGEDSIEKWVELKGMPSFDRMFLPQSTVEGIKTIQSMELWKNNPNPKVLNMTELTPLAYELGYALEAGSHIPLWYHLNVSFFDRELQLYKSRIENNYYDLVLFENIEDLNNFYPFEIRDLLLKRYKKINQFSAPRKHGGDPTIEVFVPSERSSE